MSNSSHSLPPNCYCSQPAHHYLARRRGRNQGRWFYTCESMECRFFQWDDATPRSVALPSENGRSIEAGLVRFEPCSQDEVAVHFQTDPLIVSVLRTIPDARWEEDMERWVIPATRAAYDQAFQILSTETARMPRIKVIPLPDQVLKALDVTFQVDTARVEAIERESVWQNLRPFQQDGVREAIRRNARILLGDEMGLGKTVQSLIIALAYRDTWPVLIICPSSLRFTWQSEIERWLHLDASDICVALTGNELITGLGKAINSNKRRRIHRIHFFVATYELVTQKITKVQNTAFRFIICDESHYIKSPTTKRTRTLIPLLESAEHVLLLSGTPAFARPSELYTQVSVVQPDLFSGFNEFVMRYCRDQNTRHGKQYKGAKNLQELNFILEKIVMLRRLKCDVGHQLPLKTREKLIVQLSADDGDVIGNMHEEAQRLGKQGHRMERRAMLLEMYVATAAMKIPAVQENINNFLDNTEDKLLIFAYHHNMLDAIEEQLKAKDVEYIRIDGKTNPKIRQELCDSYQAPHSTVRVALLSIVISVGMTLSKADTVIFAELYWTPSQLLQSEDRAHRMGRVGTVKVYYILANHTIDDMLWNLLKEKLKVVGEMIDGSPTKIHINESVESLHEWGDTTPSEEIENMCMELAKMEEEASLPLI